jgi:hypothetical protein
MDYLPLLGLHLKSDEIIELLELAEMEVIYSFDRLHENTPDVYWSAAREEGFQFRFDESQVLDTIFLYVTVDDEFEPINQDDCDVIFFSSLKEAESHAFQKKLQFTKGRADLLGIVRDWIRFEHAEHAVHYEFHGAKLAMVTLSLVR